MFGGRKRRRAAWSQVASELGGTHALPTKWWRDNESIEATLHGVAVKLDVYVVSTGKTTAVYTRVGADFLHGPSPRLKIQKKGFWQAIGKAIGMQDIDIGDAAFDDAFVVKSDSIAVARRLWSPAAVAQMMPFTDVWITTKPERVELVGHQLHRRAELAARDLYGLGAPSSRPGCRRRRRFTSGASAAGSSRSATRRRFYGTTSSSIRCGYARGRSCSVRSAFATASIAERVTSDRARPCRAGAGRSSSRPARPQRGRGARAGARRCR